MTLSLMAEYKYIQHNDTQFKHTQYKDTQHNVTQYKTTRILTLSKTAKKRKNLVEF
jgi:hypothetical protein